MNRFQNIYQPSIRSLAILFGLFVAGCGGGQDPILGSGGSPRAGDLGILGPYGIASYGGLTNTNSGARIPRSPTPLALEEPPAPKIGSLLPHPASNTASRSPMYQIPGLRILSNLFICFLSLEIFRCRKASVCSRNLAVADSGARQRNVVSGCRACGLSAAPGERFRALPHLRGGNRTTGLGQYFAADAGEYFLYAWQRTE